MSIFEVSVYIGLQCFFFLRADRQELEAFGLFFVSFREDTGVEIVLILRWVLRDVVGQDCSYY